MVIAKVIYKPLEESKKYFGRNTPLIKTRKWFRVVT